MNIVFLSGNLGADIEVRQTNGTTFANFSLATNHRVPTGDGETYEKRVTWHWVTAFGGQAKSMRILGKGSRVLVRGHLRTNSFTKEGVEVTRSEVIADEVEFQKVKPPAGAEAAAEDAAAEEASEAES